MALSEEQKKILSSYVCACLFVATRNPESRSFFLGFERAIRFVVGLIGEKEEDCIRPVKIEKNFLTDIVSEIFHNEIISKGQTWRDLATPEAALVDDLLEKAKGLADLMVEIDKKEKTGIICSPGGRSYIIH